MEYEWLSIRILRLRSTLLCGCGYSYHGAQVKMVMVIVMVIMVVMAIVVVMVVRSVASNVPAVPLLQTPPLYARLHMSNLQEKSQVGLVEMLQAWLCCDEDVLG